MNKIILATLGYIVCTFVIAILWHLVIFQDTYDELGYIEEEPNFLLGFSSIAIQGVLMSISYAYLRSKIEHFSPWHYVLFIGVFFWTSHVLAFSAKSIVGSLSTFMFLETIYLSIQFGLYGFILKTVFKNNR